MILGTKRVALPWQRGAFVCLVVLVATGLVGCGGGLASRVGADADVVRADATPARLLSKGDTAAAVGDLIRAEQYFAAALAAGGDSALLTRRLVRTCVADHRYRMASLYAEDHLRQAPNDGEVRELLVTLRGVLAEGTPRGAAADTAEASVGREIVSSRRRANR